MATIWILADPHFDHTALIERTPGFLTSPLRGRFGSVKEMNEFIVHQWNSRVRSKDKGYLLGDICMRKTGLAQVKLLHGQLRLVGGNHDQENLQDYIDAGIQAIYGSRVLSGILCTHIPCHPGSLNRFLGNVHGHLHDQPSPPGQYLNVSCEALDYAPITLEECVARLTKLKADTEEMLTSRGRPLTHRMQMPEHLLAQQRGYAISSPKMTPRHGGDTAPEDDELGRALEKL